MQISYRNVCALAEVNLTFKIHHSEL